VFSPKEQHLYIYDCSVWRWHRLQMNQARDVLDLGMLWHGWMSAGKEFWMDGDAVQKAQFSASMSNDYYAVCRTCICNCLHHTVCLRPNSIMLSSSRTSSRAGLRPASKLDSVMAFGLYMTVMRVQVCAVERSWVSTRHVWLWWLTGHQVSRSSLSAVLCLVVASIQCDGNVSAVKRVIFIY